MPRRECPVILNWDSVLGHMEDWPDIIVSRCVLHPASQQAGSHEHNTAHAPTQPAHFELFTGLR